MSSKEEKDSAGYEGADATDLSTYLIVEMPQALLLARHGIILLLTLQAIHMRR